MIGEAYFDVVEDPARPFTVDIGGLKVKALGTKFNIKAYPEEASISATLELGRIRVSIPKTDGRTENVILLPNENMLMQRAEKVQTDTDYNEEDLNNVIISEHKTTKNINVKKYISWKDEQWIIERLQLGELATILQRRYNVTMVFNDDDVKHYNFTGTIQNESIEQIMHAISLTAPISYNIVMDTIMVSLDRSAEEEFNYKMIEN